MLDILLSVPLISTLFTPSWSMSLNILFFYATWSALVLTHDATTIHAAALVAIRTFLWLAPSLLFVAFDSAVPSLAASIKFAGAAGLPSWTRRGSGGRKGWIRAAKLVGLAVFNALLLTAAEAGVSYAFFFFSGRPLFRTSTTLPLPWGIFKHIAILFSAREVLTYYTHRYILHGNSRLLARLHESWAHAGGGSPSSLSLYTDHPLPLLVLHVIPVLVPSALVRPHFLTYLLFMILVTGEGTMSHSGYSIVPGIILGGVARRTAIHYASDGEANYGAFGLLDFAHGSSQGKDVLEDVRDEADKHNVKQRASKRVDDGAGLIRNSVESITGSGSPGPRRSGRKKTPKRE